MSFFPFTRRTDVENLERRFAFVKLMHAHLPDFFEWKSACIPRFHSTYQVTRELRITCANKQLHDFLEIAFIFEHQENRLVWIEHPSCPNRKNGRAANVERTRNMAPAKSKHATRVHKHTRFLVDRFLERFRWKTRDARKIPENFRSLCVYFLHYRIVFRHRWRAGERVIRKTFHIIELQEPVEFSLVTDRAAQTVPDVRAARRTGTVIGINHDVIGQLEIKIAQGVKLLFRELLGVVRT